MRYIYTVEYYSAMKSNPTRSPVEMWTDLETVRDRKANIIYLHVYVEFIKNGEPFAGQE